MNKTAEQYRLLKMRERAENRFRWYGRAALIIALTLLVFLLGSIFSNGYLGFVQTQIKLPVTFDAKILELENNGNPFDTSPSAYLRLTRESLKTQFPEAVERPERRKLYALLSVGVGAQLRHALIAKPELLGKTEEFWMPASSDVDAFLKHGKEDSKLNEKQIAWVAELQKQGSVQTAFNTHFFAHGDSRTPEQ
ncbi:MAG: DUF3333 domain-containing protein, partial [Alphaproteobacteria bacterium]|nr:DUF3333 domain-containing protein [Alphaproteobacteria bacterium]